MKRKLKRKIVIGRTDRNVVKLLNLLCEIPESDKCTDSLLEKVKPGISSSLCMKKTLLLSMTSKFNYS